MKPGPIPTTRIPLGPSSIAAHLVSIATPALAAQYADMPSAGTIALIDAMLMITPDAPAATMAADSARRERKTPRRQTFITASHCSTGCECTGEYQPMPAALSARSSRPNSSVARSTMRSTDSGTVTSTISVMHASPSSSAIPASASRFRSPSTTRAPSATNRRAHSAPIPEAPPVTTPTRSRNLSPIRPPQQGQHAWRKAPTEPLATQVAWARRAGKDYPAMNSSVTYIALPT